MIPKMHFNVNILLQLSSFSDTKAQGVDTKKYREIILIYWQALDKHAQVKIITPVDKTVTVISLLIYLSISKR